MTADPRGIRDNNPGNLRPDVQSWQGELASDSGYCRFISPEMGLRALAKTLLAYQQKHGLNTISLIIERWAPPTDNNDTPAYIVAVSSACGIAATQNIDLTDASVLSSLVMAIVQHENGQQPYAVTLIERVCSRAIGDGLDW